MFIPGGAPGLLMGPCIVETDRIVIREVQYQLEGNRCRNEKWPMWMGRPIEIDHIVIILVQYQLEVNLCGNEEITVKGNFRWVWPIWVGRHRVGYGAMHKVNRCRNEEVIVKGNFGWVWPMWVGRPRIDRIFIREVQYQFEVNRCRNEEIIPPRIDRIVIREVQYQFEVNRCRNEEVTPAPTPIIFDPGFQGSNAYSDGQTGGETDRQTAEIITISPLFKKLTDLILGGDFVLNWEPNPSVNPLMAIFKCPGQFYNDYGHLIAPEALQYLGLKTATTGDNSEDSALMGSQLYQAQQDSFHEPRTAYSDKTNNAHIIGTNLLTKFHEDRKINVASRVLTRKNAPPPGSDVFQPIGIIF
ncbi:hypothetical protein DPMN_030823 [Dreissena polymorpha]|uniref:Uncharacterized protein n=1 Tax=Dreissena polymorpha TaxID=45954 RepID=A0A9D4RIP1_DREPO|nr:hypothetical protein DPMN_030823 [Dreissena polymorpha]